MKPRMYAVLVLALVQQPAQLARGQTNRPQIPAFEPDPLWSQALPNKWVTGQIGGLGVTIGDSPAHDERFGELVAQKTEARDLHREPEARRLDVDDADLEQITWLRALDEHWPGQRVHDVQVDPADVLHGRIAGDLPVERITRLQDDAVARRRAHDRRN